MYVPKHFAADDREACHALMRAYPFATITTAVPGGSGELIASHLPFLVDDRGAHGTLRLHVARASEHLDALAAGAPSLVVFAGPHAYISPRFYETHPAVPTWNYCAVHAVGIARPLDDATAHAYLGELAQHFERAAPDAWQFSAQPADYQAKMLRGIAAFELEITRLQGKAKLSQNRSPADRARVIAALEASDTPGDVALARWMAARLD